MSVPVRQVNLSAQSWQRKYPAWVFLAMRMTFSEPQCGQTTTPFGQREASMWSRAVCSLMRYHWRKPMTDFPPLFFAQRRIIFVSYALGL